ncbi:MAG TPA: hypothetical protein VHV30_10235 [Polyangiaceae bacterium]|jgi:hypothetical protein|nr:hypothetical protein [Polyangiaceae bacterium]
MNRCVAAAAIAVACALASLAAPEARAQSGATLVAIVTSDPTSSLTRRVRAELEGVGLDVIVLKPPDEATTSRGPLERAARSVGAVAAVRLVASSEGKVEVWVADRVTGKAVVRELDASESGASDAAVAIGSVELLRASLMELHSSEPPHGDAPATPKIEALALPASPDASRDASSSSRGSALPRFGLAAGAGAAFGVRGLGPSADANLSLWLRATSRLGARIVGATSLSPAEVTTPAGGVEVRSLLVGAMAEVALADPTSTWVPSLAAGVAAAHVAATGTAVPPYVSGTGAAWAAAPLGDLGLAWSFAPGLRLRGDALVAWALPQVQVRTPTTDIGGWGDPAVMVSLGLEVLWSR